MAVFSPGHSTYHSKLESRRFPRQGSNSTGSYLLLTYLDDFLTPENFSFLVFKEFKMSHGLLCRTVPASVWPWIANMPAFGGKKFKIEIASSIWREEIQNRYYRRFGGKKFKIEIDSSILAGRNSLPLSLIEQSTSIHRCGPRRFPTNNEGLQDDLRTLRPKALLM